MPRTLFEHLSPDTGAKRILALDGGGVRSILTLGMLKALEDELRRRAGGDNAFRLSDYYDLIGGTASGAIIASGLALGRSVDELIAFFARIGPDVFGRRAGGDQAFLQPRLDSRRLRQALQSVFSTKTLGSEELKTGLALFAKRIDSGAAWTLTNHPLGAFYDPPAGSDIFPNKRYRLAELLAASAAAPAYFDEAGVHIEFDDRRRPLRQGFFVDGAMSGANNPGPQLLLLSLQPSSKFGWTPGPENLMMTSFGAGWRQPRIDGATYQSLPPDLRGAHVLRALIRESEAQAVAWMQALSQTKKPWVANGSDDHSASPSIGAPLLDYQRIDVTLDHKPKLKRRSDPTPPMTHMERLIGRELNAEDTEQLDQPGNGHPKNMALLLEIGVAAGKTFVGEGYPDPRFDLPGWGSA